MSSLSNLPDTSNGEQVCRLVAGQLVKQGLKWQERFVMHASEIKLEK